MLDSYAYLDGSYLVSVARERGVSSRPAEEFQLLQGKGAIARGVEISLSSIPDFPSYWNNSWRPTTLHRGQARGSWPRAGQYWRPK